MVHPHLGEDQVPARVDETAFNQVWKLKGWELYEEPAKVPEKAPAKPKDRKQRPEEKIAKPWEGKAADSDEDSDPSD